MYRVRPPAPLFVSISRLMLVRTAVNPSLPHMRYQAWGIAGLIFWSIMVFGSIRPIRRRFYKSFIFTHIFAFALSIICLSFHRPQVAPYLAAAAVVYILDRLVRFGSLVYFNLFRAVALGQGPTATVAVVGKDVIKVQVSTGLAWKPGECSVLSPSPGS